MLKHHFPHLRLICFDLDDTLWPCYDAIMAAEEALFQWLQATTPRLTKEHSIASLRQHRRLVAEREPHIAHDMTLLRQRHLELLLIEHSYDPAIAPIAAELFQQHRNRVQPYDDVPLVLQQLRQDYLLASLTNGNAQVHKTPLAGMFHFSLTAADVGFAKPHPALFAAALAKAGVRPHEALHIGDDLERDVVPALALGMHAIHLLRQPLVAQEKAQSQSHLDNASTAMQQTAAQATQVQQINRLDLLLEKDDASA